MEISTSTSLEKNENQKIKPTLPNDCIAEILPYLEDNVRTLYSCARVSRSWCQLTIPLLWSKPFDTNTITPNTKIISLIRTLGFCLDNPTKKFLIQQHNFNPDGFKTTKPFFDYPSYIRGFNYSIFLSFIRIWLRKVLKRKPELELTTLLFKSIGNLIFSRTRGFESLNISYNDREENEYELDDEDSEEDDTNDYVDLLESNIRMELYDITLLENFNNAITNIEKFTYCYVGLYMGRKERIFFEVMKRIFEKLTENCKNIKKLTIYAVPENLLDVIYLPVLCKATANLIKVQKNISSITFNQEWVDLPNNPFYSSLLSERVVSSLRSLKLCHINDFDGLLKVLCGCNNLETLEFTDKFYVSDVNHAIQRIMQYPPIHIKHLHFYSFEYDEYAGIETFISSIEVLFRLSNNNLRSLTIGDVDANLIKLIGSYCTNLNYLSIELLPELFPALNQTLLSLNNLEHLILAEGKYSIYPRNNNGRRLFPNLNFRYPVKTFAKSLPISLKHLGLDINLNNEVLDQFLSALKCPLHTLDIYDGMKVEYLEIIIKYVENNNSILKQVGFRSVNVSLGNEESFNKFGRVMARIFGLIQKVYMVKKHLHDSFSDFAPTDVWLR
ncbi:5465_t:CDS:1 [Funneliformis geosporum]|uniref:5465_t:CDS:1 n=1 Tax=Funneliformis geosporum TaxID=1117311 RepID=A0A9W4SH72_9GLOM|nr:5465_t:CDS:1 [Funneliformis geosporum]